MLIDSSVTFKGIGPTVGLTLGAVLRKIVSVGLHDVLRTIFGPKRDEVTGGWRKLHNEELHNLYSFPSIIRMIKSRIIKWAGHVA
jgi:hypothetical protein